MRYFCIGLLVTERVDAFCGVARCKTDEDCKKIFNPPPGFPCTCGTHAGYCNCCGASQPKARDVGDAVVKIP